MRAAYPLVPLGELCDVLDSKRRPITKRDRVEGEFPYYGATGILGYVEGYIFDEPLVLIGEDGAKWGVGENTAFSAEGRYWVNNHAHVIRPHRHKILDAWIIYQLNQADLSEFITGLTVPKLNQAKMREIPIIVPPLDEQRRIVAVLDKAFAAIATATANAQKNLTNARALFDSYIDSVFSVRTKDWTAQRLGNVATLQRGFDLPTQDRVGGNVPLVSSSGVIARVAEAKVTAPGVTTGRSGSIGSVFYIDEDFWPLNTSLYVKDFHDNNPRFVYWLLRNFDLSKFATGSGVPTLNRNFVHDEVVWIPHDTDVQSTLAKSFDELNGECAKIEAVISRKLLALSELKQSLLQKAFAGELI